MKMISWDFPGGPAVKNLPSNAGSIPSGGTNIWHPATTEPGEAQQRSSTAQKRKEEKGKMISLETLLQVTYSKQTWPK